MNIGKPKREGEAKPMHEEPAQPQPQPEPQPRKEEHVPEPETVPAP
jgi:hypothetical protein